MPEARDLPLFAWSAELRRTAEKRRRLRSRVLVTAFGVALLGTTIVAPAAPRLVWNVSASAPVGLYGVMSNSSLRRGDMVVAWPPQPHRKLAAERRYLPFNVPLVKTVGAIPGDQVCAIGESLYVNGRGIVRRLPHDGAGRPMPFWTGCQKLGHDQYLLLMAGSAASFDGRYFGPVRLSHIAGKAVPLWVR
jgi:conjugative transfer signal peptidase TraF